MNIKEQLAEHIALFNELEKEGCLKTLESAITSCVACLEKGGKILFCGNGGSAADSQHLAAEFVVRFRKNRKAYAAIALTTDTSILTAASNDFDFSQVFSRQIEGLANSGDVIFLISTSGTSPNIIKAQQAAQSLGVKSVAVTGDFNVQLGRDADIWWRIPSKDTARIQEAYLFLGHLLCDLVEQKLG